MQDITKAKGVTIPKTVGYPKYPCRSKENLFLLGMKPSVLVSLMTELENPIHFSNN